MPDPKLVSSVPFGVVAGEGQAVAGGGVVVGAGDDDGAVIGIGGGGAGVVDGDGIAVDGGSGAEVGEHFAAGAEGGVKRAGGGVASECELTVVIAGDDDLAVALKRDGRAVGGGVAAGAEAGGELAAGAKGRVQHAGAGIAGEGEVVVAVAGNVDVERRPAGVIGIGLEDNRLGRIRRAKVGDGLAGADPPKRGVERAVGVVADEGEVAVAGADDDGFAIALHGGGVAAVAARAKIGGDRPVPPKAVSRFTTAA